MGSSRFNVESIPKTEGIAYTSIIASSGTILGDLVSTVPPMLYGLSITGTGTRFSLPRAGMPLLDVDPTDATHINLLTLFGFFLFLCLLSNLYTLQVLVSTAQSWYTAAISAHKYFVDFTSAYSIRPFLLATYCSYFIQMNVFMNACDL